MLRFLTITAFFCCFLELSAQRRPLENLELGISSGSGYVLPEYDFINLLTEGPSVNFEFQLQKNTYGKNDWERLYHYPSYGIRFLYSDLGSPNILGTVWAIYPYFKVSIFELGRLKLSTDIGLGYSRVSKKFDLETNFLNVAVGSHSNLHFNNRFMLDYQLMDRLKVNTGLSFDHFSNGNTSEPNLGINWLSWIGGISYALGKEPDRITDDPFPLERTVEQELTYAVGGKHSRALASTYYFTSSLSYELRKKYFRVYHLGLGADLFYDTSVKDQLEKEERSFQSSDNFQTGMHFTQYLIYDRFSLGLQIGTYLLLPEKVENYSVYSRMILKYRIGEHLSTRFTMKSHLHILDYPEIGIGWIF